MRGMQTASVVGELHNDSFELVRLLLCQVQEMENGRLKREL